MAKIIAKKKTGRPGVEVALRLEPEQPGAVAVLEDQPSDAEGGADGEQVRDDAERGDQRRLERDEQEQEAEHEHDADDERRLRGERLLEVVVLGGRAPDERTCGERVAEPVDRAADGRVGGIGGRDGLDERTAVAARLRRRDTGDAAVGARGRGDRRGVALRRDDLERAGGAGAEGLLHLRVADAGASRPRGRP